MFEFIQGQIIFYAALAFVLFLPGYALLLALFGKNKTFDVLERFILSFGLSIVLINFLLFAYDKIKLPITRLSIVAGVLVLVGACYYFFQKKPHAPKAVATSEKYFTFSQKQTALIFLLLVLAFLIRTTYLGRTISPNATDLGHHMYWAKEMVTSHTLPTYEGMPDFIIGEQTIFGTLAILTGASFFSAFPATVLYLIDLLGILTVFILILRVFKNSNISILSLLFLGALYAVASPQAKFVSGGVVGNIFGNFLMPLTIYFLARAFAFFAEKNTPAPREAKIFLALGIFTTFGLFYTHHLTAFIFSFVMLFFLIAFVIFNFKNFREILLRVKELLLSPYVLTALIGGLIFFFLVFTPNYVNPSAVETAVGAPSKASREGLSLNTLKSSVGEVRFGLGLFGFLVLSFFFWKKDRRQLGQLLLLAWFVVIFLISTVPGLFFINLPSDRIGNYLSYPLAILSAYGLFFAFQKIRSTTPLTKAAFLLLITFSLVSGLSDSAVAMPKQDDYAPLVETFHASQYLAERTTDQDIIIKDHNYIAGDSWMKLFFMRGYKYPQSRGFFKRYEDITKPREMCTLHMISTPNSSEALQCYAETGTNFAIINPKYDSAQFRKLTNFDQIYSNPGITIYYRHP